MYNIYICALLCFVSARAGFVPDDELREEFYVENPMQRAMGDVVPAAADGSEGPTAAPIIADACYDTTVESSRAQNPWDNTCFGVCYENLFGPSYPRPCQYRTGKTSADWTEAQVGELSSFVDAMGGTPVDSCGSYEVSLPSPCQLNATN